jgi:hypothetical protein
MGRFVNTPVLMLRRKISRAMEMSRKDRLSGILRSKGAFAERGVGGFN